MITAFVGNSTIAGGGDGSRAGEGGGLGRGGGHTGGGSVDVSVNGRPISLNGDSDVLPQRSAFTKIT